MTIYVPPGVYDIRVKGVHSLRTLSASADLTSDTSVDMGLQLEGDFDNDNVADSSDYSTLLIHFGSLTADAVAIAPQLGNLDFNQDGVIDSSDYSRLLANFGKGGVDPF
ncbi:MAG: hypothetical protein IIC82_06585, partial [Chloroflexi bacterium]|nr:hypothetical protein [Chloroflexota bacterium]